MSPTVAPSPSSTAIESPGTAGDRIPLDTYARVVTSDLRVRSMPGVSEDSRLLRPLLQRGVLLVVLDGPVEASGFRWYQVQPTIGFEVETYYPFGWVAAAGKDGERWIKPARIECPPLPTDVSSLAYINETDQMFYEVTCFAGRQITFQARLGSPEAMCGMEGPWATKPAWLDRCHQDPSFLVPVDDDSTGSVIHPAWAPDIDLSIAVDPQAPQSAWPIVEVTGQFDHPAARKCRNVVNYESPGDREPDPSRTILECRVQFVVTSMTRINS